MPRKDFVKLMEENALMMDRLAQRLKLDPAKMSGYPRQQVTAIVRLYTGGAARLKDIADRDMCTVANLCAMFRKLERDGLVARRVDDADRRNTFYSVTPAGAKIAENAIGIFCDGISEIFAGLSRVDEDKMTAALKTINEVLNKIEVANA